MPEFHIDANDPTQDGRTYASLDSFTQGYIEAAFFTSTGPDNDEEGLGDASFSEIAPEALDKVIADCAEWQKENADLLQSAYETESGYDEQRAGNDYWYTRNGHGVGFWDRKELECDSVEYETLTAKMVSNRDNPDAWGAACAKRSALNETSIGAMLSKAAGRLEVNLVRGDDGLIYFE